MVKVIETNISLDDNDNFADHQSRVIEVSSWQDLIEEVVKNKVIYRKSILGGSYGPTLPIDLEKINNIIYDERHLSCDVTTYSGWKSKKLLYLID